MSVRRAKGEGSISKRTNGKWRAYVTKGGERVHFTGNTKSECQEWMRSMLNQFDKGLTVNGAKTTVREYLEKWLNSNKFNYESQTYLDYSRYCRKDITPILGNMKLKDLSIQIINDLYAKLFTDGKGLPTIKYIHRVFHSALNAACVEGYLAYNPSNRPTFPNPKSHQAVKMMSIKEMASKESDADLFEEDYVDDEMQVWTESELSHFLVTALGNIHYCLFDLETKTGLRAGELLGLLIRDVEFRDDYALIKVQRQIKKVKDVGWVFLTPKTKSGVRTLKVGANTARVLKEHLHQIDIIKQVNKKNWHEYGLLFPSGYGTPIDLSNLRKDYNTLIQEAHLRKIRFHDLRHTVASILLSNKIPVGVVSRMLGHAKVSTTLNFYCHFIPSSSEEATYFMDAFTPIPLDIARLADVNGNDLSLDNSEPVEYVVTPLSEIGKLDIFEDGR
jgi:integrase